MTEVELSEVAKRVLTALPSDGSAIGGIAIKKSLGLGDPEYRNAKQQLTDSGLAVPGAGKGGTLRLSGISAAGARRDSMGLPSRASAVTHIRSLSKLALAIQRELPDDGSMIGNTSLMRQLKLEPPQFFLAKEELMAAGLAVAGKGRGGSTGLAQVTERTETRPTRKGVQDEADLYEPTKRWFDEHWGPEYRQPNYYKAVVTGTPRGHKRKSGLWSRPDITILTVSCYPFLPTRQVELTTVEIKAADSLDTSAVFEAASHGKVAHFAYLAVEWLGSKDMPNTEDDNVQAVLKEAKRFDVGVMQIEKRGHGRYELVEVVEPKRREPDPGDCNAFIEQRFRDLHDEIRNALGRF
jgi:hypothetical protein